MPLTTREGSRRFMAGCGREGVVGLSHRGRVRDCPSDSRLITEKLGALVKRRSVHHLPNHFKRGDDRLAADLVAAEIAIPHGLMEDRLVLASNCKMDQADGL